MSKIQRMHTSQRMSKCVVHNKTIYLCGQVGFPDTSVAEQTKEALSRVEKLLIEAGSNKDNILQATVWLADMKDFNDMNEIWDQWFNEGMVPARACGEARLATPELRVEIIVIAALPS